MKKVSRYGLASFLIFFSLSVILSGRQSAYGGWLDLGKKKEETPKSQTAPGASKNAVKPPALSPQRSPNQSEAFNEKMQKQRMAFEEKFRALPTGPREKTMREFEEKARADRAVFEQEVSTYPPDEKETAQKEFSDKIQEDQRQFYEKLSNMPPGKKEIARVEFDKKFQEEQTRFSQKLNAMPPDPKDTARNAFEEKARK